MNAQINLDSDGPRLNVLVLHGIPDFAQERQTTIRHVRAFQRYSKGHRFAYQYIGHSVTDRLKSVPWDVVLLDATFLGWRWVRPRAVFEQIKADYSWLRDSGAYLVALPQDDFDHSDLLDAWLANYEIDLLYTVYSEHWPILYPRLIARNTPIVMAFTGYIDDDDIALYRSVRRPFGERTIDVGYRVRRLMTCGRFGVLKSEFGRRFAAAANGLAVTDISDDPADTILGEGWPRFLGNARFALGSEGGSSVLDRDGEIRDRTMAYMAEHPEANFEEVASTCLFPEDEAYAFTALSPRVFEAAMAGCCPILMRGRFSELIKPEEHYIPVAPDFRDIAMVVERLRDHGEGERIAARAEEALLGNPALRYSRWVADAMASFRQGLEGRKICGALSDWEFASRIEQHQVQVRSQELRSKNELISGYMDEIRRLNGSFSELQSQRNSVLKERDQAQTEVHRLSLLLELAISQRESALNERNQAHAEVRRLSQLLKLVVSQRDSSLRERDLVHEEK